MFFIVIMIHILLFTVMASVLTHFKLDKLEKFRRRQQPVEAEAEEDREVGVYCLVLEGGGKEGKGE